MTVRHDAASFARGLTLTQPVGLDVLLAMVLMAWNVLWWTLGTHRTGWPAWQAVLTCSLVLAVAVRRLLPLPALAVASVTMATEAAVGVSGILATALLVYEVAVTRPARVAAYAVMVAGAAQLALTIPLQGITGHSWGWPGMIQVLIVEGAAWAIGWSIRQSRAYTRGLVEQAEERAQLLLAEERIRIARELHDVVAHSLSIVAVQAGVGHHVIGSRPDEAAKSLSVIETTSRAALGELRSLLGVLRDHDDAEWLPGGLDDLNTLLEQTRRAGVQVELTISGHPHALPRGLDRAAYRILQEALTNVVKHARTSHAQATVDYAPGEVALTVVDAGAGRTSTPVTEGHGLTGMKERAALYGGEVHAGPLSPHGFRVNARLLYATDERTAQLPVGADPEDA
ncbi:sensor histidine kinase [Streptomyces sp. Ag109_O5-1]|uniref:sensor histidine kinase n=1 Tax=Streptomyces sp. Ag109_O5-1 TaxID=1938851 RepID=UPI001628470D|nr:sensor histidine kinase [Streptomyces sp. Ag109_O5-1]